MKKLVSLVLSVSLFLVLCSCGEVTPEVSSEETSSAVSSSLHYTTDERYEEVTKEVFESFVGKNLRNFTYTVTTADIFGKLIREGGPEIKIAMEELLAGKTLKTQIDEQIVFHQLDNRVSAIWSFLLASGYLKAVRLSPVCQTS